MGRAVAPPSNGPNSVWLQAFFQQLPHRLIEAVKPYCLDTSLKPGLVASVAVEDQPGLLARMTLEPSHAQRVDDALAARTKCSLHPATLASSTRHCTEIGHTRR